MRYICIDLGEKRTGVAAGDDVTSMVSPVTVLAVPRGPALLTALTKTIREHEPHAIVIGLPLNMDGTEGAGAQGAREFGEQLAQQIGLPVHYQDERLTSYAANQAMSRTGRTHKQKKELRDALAAAEILRDFLDQQSRSAGRRG